MDAEKISILRTVVIAGRVRSGFNQDANSRLEELAQQGFLVEASVSKRKGPNKAYTPTEQGKDFVRRLSAANEI